MPLLAIVAAAALLSGVHSCSTTVVGRLASTDGSVIASHSNDGDGDVAGTLRRINASAHSLPSTRSVSHGAIPQVAHTFAYFTEGYAAMNEHQLGLAESTCAGVRYNHSRSPRRSAAAAAAAALNIVDLGQIALERAQSSREAVETMGALSEQYGYVDNAESLLVVDPSEAWIFHILRDDTGSSAVWVAQRVADDGVATVMNAFTIRAIDFTDNVRFLSSSNLRAVALRQGLWRTGTPLDFALTFGQRGLGANYASGRRMWYALSKLAPKSKFSSIYNDLRIDAPYPAVVRVAPKSVALRDVFAVMRSFYQNTTYDLRRGLAGGAWGSPDRAAPGAAERAIGAGGGWERSIATHRSIVTIIIQARGWLPSAVGGVLWFAPHAAHTSIYVPFPVGMPVVPATHANTSWSFRRHSAYWAFRWIYNTVQLKFAYMHADVMALQESVEQASLALIANVSAAAAGGWSPALTHAFAANAEATVAAAWELADNLVKWYADGYCNGCPHPGTPRHMGYDKWWLVAANYTGRGCSLPQEAALTLTGGGGREGGGTSGAGAAECVARCVAPQAAGQSGKKLYNADCVDRCVSQLLVRSL
tara:strand:- start:2405 stop:4174 length:1770 start_codon:yes stop_codon:yes gene_type:complete